MKRVKFLILITTAIFSISHFHNPVFSWSDQTTTERILRENKYFISFIDLCISNFVRDKENDFFKIYEKHFNADVAYLQSDYKRAFKRIYSSQKLMVKLYEEVLANFYLEDSKKILDDFAPGIIRSKNARARLYLTLGYRDRTISWNFYMVGNASNPKLYSYKLYKYEEGIKMARRAKRYGFLALFESQAPKMKMKIFNRLLKSEKEKGNKFFNRFLDKNEKDYIDEMNKTYNIY